MFQTEQEIRRRTPAGSLDRFAYLQQLVTEFQTTESQACKYEVLASLANFSYDPMNYGHLKRLNVTDLFLDMLSEEDEKLVEFGIGGLCNLALERELKVFILQNDGVSLVKQCLASKNTEIITSAITTLMFLTTPSSKQVLHHELSVRLNMFNQRRSQSVLIVAVRPGLLVMLCEICSEDTVQKMVEFCESQDQRISNLANIFMQDYCPPEKQKKLPGGKKTSETEDETADPP